MKKVSLNVLVACEESQATTKELRLLGHNAYSCDLQECSGGNPQWHFNCDVFEVIKGSGITQDGTKVSVLKWDLMIAHPPCTYLTVSGARWFYHPEDKHLPAEQRRPHPNYPNRAKDRQDALEFVKALFDSPIDYIAIENPVGTLNTKWMKPNQTIQPWMFGHGEQKGTCLWLKNLPCLVPTDIVEGREQAIWKMSPSADRGKKRSVTYSGIAKAMASQWTDYILNITKYTK